MFPSLLSACFQVFSISSKYCHFSGFCCGVHVAGESFIACLDPSNAHSFPECLFLGLFHCFHVLSFLWILIMVSLLVVSLSFAHVPLVLIFP